MTHEYIYKLLFSNIFNWLLQKYCDKKEREREKDGSLNLCPVVRKNLKTVKVTKFIDVKRR